MKKETKFIILIVEGITDQDVYEMILTPFLEKSTSSKEIRCKCTKGDLFSEKSAKIHNLKSRIGNQIRDYLDKNYLNPSDIEAIIQICDIDGIYLSKEKIVDISDSTISYGYNNNGELLRYCNESNINQLYDTYQSKKELLSVACTYQEINVKKNKIPYRLFYQSLFLENLINNGFINSFDKKRKNKVVKNFIDKLAMMENDEIIEFSTQFFKDKLINNIDDYKDSWNKLDEINCLSVSNLYLLIDILNKLS